MRYINTRDKSEKLGFKEAVIKGLGRNKGLFVPESIPVLEYSFIDNINEISDTDIARTVLYPYLKDSIDKQEFYKILEKILAFPKPLIKVNEKVFSLELFHGPTQAFKDFGARFMASCLSSFSNIRDRLTVLVATSGDTGAAVANGFYRVDGVQVVILYPRGKISPYQEQQMCTLKGNIHAIEIDGSFDDCQRLVKQAFSDAELGRNINLSSANSINIARLLPQMLFFFFAVKQFKILEKDDPVISVPSGNFGNMTAGVYAKAMGLPIKRFVAANNLNDTFQKFMESGQFQPVPSQQTYSNAMDIGDPSNFERLNYHFGGDIELFRSQLHAYSISDHKTLEEIRNTYRDDAYLLDPHGAVGKVCLQKDLKAGEKGIFLETAHPRKFEEVVKMAIPEIEFDNQITEQTEKISLPNDYLMVRESLLGLA